MVKSCDTYHPKLLFFRSSPLYTFITYVALLFILYYCLSYYDQEGILFSSLLLFSTRGKNKIFKCAPEVAQDVISNSLLVQAQDQSLSITFHFHLLQSKNIPNVRRSKKFFNYLISGISFEGKMHTAGLIFHFSLMKEFGR